MTDEQLKAKLAVTAPRGDVMVKRADLERLLADRESVEATLKTIEKDISRVDDPEDALDFVLGSIDSLREELEYKSDDA